MKIISISLIPFLVILFVHVSPSPAASKAEIDAKAEEALAMFYKHTSAGEKLAKKAAGILVFPKVIKAGIGIGGEYGEGGLMFNLTLEGSKITKIKNQ